MNQYAAGVKALGPAWDQTGGGGGGNWTGKGGRRALRWSAWKTDFKFSL